MPDFSLPHLVKTFLRCIAAVPVLLVLAIGLADFAHSAVDHMRLVAAARQAAEISLR